MKVKPSPTSPKAKLDTDALEKLYAQERGHFDHPVRRSSSPWTVIALAIVAGFTAGALSVPALQALGGRYPNSSFFATFVQENSNTDIRIIRETDTRDEEESRRRSLAENVFPQTLALYTSKDSDSLSDVLTQNDFLGHAVIVTSDGLAMTQKDVLTNASVSAVALTHDHRLFEVTDIFFDPASPFVFFRIEAQNLSVGEFSNVLDVTLGSTIYVLGHSSLSHTGELTPTALVTYRTTVGENFAAYIHDADMLDAEFLISASYEDFYQAAPVLTRDGKILGFIKESDGLIHVTPAFLITPVLQDAIQQKVVQRPSFGAQYLDLGEAMNIPIELSQGRTAGAVLTATTLQAAVDSDGPADTAGLEAGDILLEVNGIPLNGRVKLHEEIQKLRSGDEVRILLLRDSLEKEVIVTLEKRET